MVEVLRVSSQRVLLVDQEALNSRVASARFRSMIHASRPPSLLVFHVFADLRWSELQKDQWREQVYVQFFLSTGLCVRR